MNSTSTTYQAVARELAEAFEAVKRDDGSTFYRVKDSAADWINSDVMHSVHQALDERFPDDWVYETAAHLADCLGHDTAEDSRDELHEIADGMVDVYNASLTAWLADHLGNAALVDEACEEMGADGLDTFKRIQIGQFMAIERIGGALTDAIEAEADSRE